jgi:hypothetical protein
MCDRHRFSLTATNRPASTSATFPSATFFSATFFSATSSGATITVTSLSRATLSAPSLWRQPAGYFPAVSHTANQRAGRPERIHGIVPSLCTTLKEALPNEERREA